MRQYFLDYLFQFLLLPYSSSQKIQQTTISSQSQLASSSSEEATLSNSATHVSETPACLSEAAYKKFKMDINLDNSDEVENVSVVQFTLYICKSTELSDQSV